MLCPERGRSLRAGSDHRSLDEGVWRCLSLPGSLLFGSQAGGVFADEPDEELPPGTITNFRAESNQPYGYYVSWDPPTPTPTFYYLEWTSLANDNWTCHARLPEQQEAAFGDTVSQSAPPPAALVPDVLTPQAPTTTIPTPSGCRRSTG